jgi:hypothetical protein
MYQTKTDEELIHALEYGGEAPHPDLIAECLSRRGRLSAPLLQMFENSLNDAWEAPDDPRWYRQVHAGKLLTAFQEPAALPTFERIYASLLPQEQEALQWFDLDMAYYGPTAVPILLRLINLDTKGEYHFGCSLASAALAIIGRQHSETREEIVAALRRQLPALRPDGAPDTPDDLPNHQWSNAANALAELGDIVSRPQIEALFNHKMIDESVIDFKTYQGFMAGDEDLLYPFDFDLVKEYTGQYEAYLKMQNAITRAALLREQGFTPPLPSASPIESEPGNWFNDKLLGKRE